MSTATQAQAPASTVPEQTRDALDNAVTQLADALQLLCHLTKNGGLRDAGTIAGLARSARDNAETALMLTRHSIQFPD